MDLLRHWRRRALGAAAAAVIAPLAIVLAALAVGFGGGGIGSLGALGQAFAGPEIPDIGPLPADGGRAASDQAGRLLARTQPEPGSRPRSPAPAGPGAPGRGSPDGSRRGDGQEETARIRRPTPTGSPNSPGSPQPTPAPQPTPQPGPQPTPEPSTVRQVGDQVKEVTEPVPVVGPPAGEVVDLIVETAEGLPLPRLP